MMELSDILTQNLIKYPLKTGTKEEIISQLIDLLVKNHKLSKPSEAKAAILKREELMSTGVGKGVALPHGKYAYIDDVLITFGISPEGINFDAVDGQPVHIFVLLLTPENHPSKHLKLLSKFSRMLNIAECREELLSDNSAEEILATLVKFDKTL